MSELKIVGKVELPPKPPEPIWHAVCEKCGAVSEGPASAWKHDFGITWLVSWHHSWGKCHKCGNTIHPIKEPAPDHLRTES